ncbi:probable indole-3-pyruvate monooxygenase YUCCA10 [Rosa rugosa]|uniref:probable indole-3-pyruvate monooxygenase YUCCA10 n=1 Tax=Rosa rugosa TaxID=74645 RepID=UPI002B4044A4|nr:probable indole-3-pyruvate monooxygenase YUCCA10 [Rosa rugosa]
MPEAVVIIVGAGPSGLAMAGCLSRLEIPYLLLEREDCYAPLWKKYSYDRLHLHLHKQVCELPHMSFPSSYPTYVPKKQFIQYLDDYLAHFKISPVYHRNVESASYDQGSERWVVKTINNDEGCRGEEEEFLARFLVVATGETTDPYVPEIEGLSSFNGEVLHSTRFKSGAEFKNKNVLVVGSGNSGLEIALDLANHGAKTSIIVRSPIHFLSRRMMYWAVVLVRYLSLSKVESLMVLLSKLVYGDMTKYGIARPKEGPFSMKIKYGKYPTIDVGTCSKIKSGEIQVLPAEIASIRGNDVELKNGKSYQFESIVFCTGFKRSTCSWLKGGDYLLKEDGIPRQSVPNHWKGQKGLYCVGLAGRGLYVSSVEAQNTANDIKSSL